MGERKLELVKNASKRSVDNDINGSKMESNSRSSSGAKSHSTEVKRRKKMKEINGHPQTSEKPLNSKNRCAFCHSSNQTEGSGPLVSYAQGKQVVGNTANLSKVTHVHEKCIQWAPRIYFKDEIIQNLESEVIRANKLNCSSCGKKGAGLGCYMESCQRTYHVPCAFYISDCRWDDTYLMFCPEHATLKFPSEKESDDGKDDTEKRVSTRVNARRKALDAGQNMVFCGSDLSSEEKCCVVEFASNNKAKMSKYWRPDVTHVIASIDSNGACARTYKLLMAILNGKWIVSVEWVKACVKAGSLVDEEPYEVHLDTHGCSGGPKAGRLRVLNKGPKLFNNLEFYFVGDFAQAYKTDLKNLVTTGGGTIIESRDQLLSSTNNVKRASLVVYNVDISDYSEFDDEDSIKFQRLAAAQDIAQESQSHVVEHIWILESIAGCCLQPFT